MIIWLFTLVDILAAIVLLGGHYDFFTWKTIISYAIALGGKAIVFNDRFLSFIDIFAAIYMILLVFIDGNVFTWIFLCYFGYKILMALF